jgi:HAD superfamily hydrolase (TIGR01484 family)
MAMKIKFVATDLDGTLIGNGETPEDFVAFREQLQALRGRWQTRWGIITGRHVESLREVLNHFLMWHLRPDYVVAEDARIFKLDARMRLIPFIGWNLGVDSQRFWLKWRCRRRMRDWCEQLRERFPEAVDMSRPGIDVWIKLKSEDEALGVECWLRELTADQTDYLVFRWGAEVCLAPGIGTKEQALVRLCQHCGIHAEHVFAVGDGANDVAMLSGRAAAMPACVGNAASDVTGAVRNASGYVARNNGLKGVMEAMQVYLD